MFFDARRYNLDAVGRYKFDRKVSLANRILGTTVAETVVNPVTGEIVAEAGEKITLEVANAIEDSLVNEVYVKTETERTVKVFSNGTVRPELVLGYDLSDCGVKVGEKVRYSVLKEIVAAADAEGVSGDARTFFIKEEAKKRYYELCPRHITKEDIFSSINYLLNLTHGIGSTDDIDHLGNRRLRCVGELLQNQMRIGMSRMDSYVYHYVLNSPCNSSGY